MANSSNNNNKVDREWSELQILEERRQDWHCEDEIYRQACFNVVSDQEYIREARELAPYIAYMMLCHPSLHTRGAREQMADDISATIESLMEDLPLIFEEVDRIKEVERVHTIELLKSLEAEKGRTQRAEAYQRQKARKAAQSEEVTC